MDNSSSEIIAKTPLEIEVSLNEHLKDESLYRDRVEKSLASIHKTLGDLPKKDDMLTKDDIDKGLNLYFQRKGKLLFTMTVSAGILMGAITGIFLGLKSILAVFGFMLIHK